MAIKGCKLVKENKKITQFERGVRIRLLMAERVYSERVSQTSQVSIVDIACKWLSIINVHEHKCSLSPGLASQTSAPNLLKQTGLPTHICK